MAPRSCRWRTPVQALRRRSARSSFSHSSARASAMAWGLAWHFRVKPSWSTGVICGWNRSRTVARVSFSGCRARMWRSRSRCYAELLPRHPLFKPYLALVAVCFFWGTTYLGIRMALESFAPLKLICFRFLISGTLMVGFALSRGHYLPRGRELAGVSFNGLLTLGVGNGALVYAETLIPSGIAGLIITISPFWMVGVEALLPGGAALHLPTIGGMLVGLAGTALLFMPSQGPHTIDPSLLAGFLMLQLGMAGWSFGSIFHRRKPGRAHPIIVSGVQQLAVGVAMIPFVPT